MAFTIARDLAVDFERVAVTAVVVVHWALIWLFDVTTDGFVFTTAMPVLLLLTLVLAGLSWQDDRRGLSAGLRLAVPLDQIRFKHDMQIYGVHNLPVAW